MGRLKCGAILWFLVGSAISGPLRPALAANPMRVEMQENTVSVYSDERVLLRYRYRDVPFKPCVQQLFSPGGVNILLDAPSDHLHHHALMFAVTANGVNFWEEQKAPGLQVHRGISGTIIDKRNNVPFAGFSQNIEWMNPRNGKLLLKERRTIEVCHLSEPKVTLLTWESKLEPATGKKEVMLTGSHYHGLGMRFIRAMDEAGEFRNADGKAGEIFRGEERLVRSKWCAYTAKANGKNVTVAMFDHPGNERHPATWFTMAKPFAYMSATLSLHEQPLKIEPEKPLVLRYGIALWDGRAKVEEIEKVYEYWAAGPRQAVGIPKKQPVK